MHVAASMMSRAQLFLAAGLAGSPTSSAASEEPVDVANSASSFTRSELSPVIELLQHGNEDEREDAVGALCVLSRNR